MKSHIGVDAHSGLVHTGVGTAANVNDVTQAGALLHGKEKVAFADAGYQGVDKRPEAKGPNWHVATRPGKRKQLDQRFKWARMLDEAEHLTASIRAEIEHTFRVLKQQFGYTKARDRGLKKNTAQIVTLFALSNLWMARRQFMAGAA